MIDVGLNAVFNPPMNFSPIELAIKLAGSQTALAAAIGASQQQVWAWAHGRPIPFNWCPAIEFAVGGAVRVETLCSAVRWVRVPDPAWPHPEGRPCVDVLPPPAADIPPALVASAEPA